MIDNDFWEKVAHIMVDSGQVMIGDPCYIKSDFNKDAFTHDEFVAISKLYQEAKKYPLNYIGASAASCSDKQWGTLDEGSAVSVSSGYGDGTYPVYVQKDRGGRIVAALIDFGNILDADEDDEYDVIESDDEDENGELE